MFVGVRALLGAAVLVFCALLPGLAQAATPDAPARLTAATSVLSPNGDGRLDQVKLTVTVLVPAYAEVHVFNASGTPVRTLFAGDVAPGDHGHAWDGRADDGTRLPDGEYRARLKVRDAAGQETETRVPLRLDATAPALRFSASGGRVTGGLAAAYSSQDAASALTASYALVGAYGGVYRRWTRKVAPGEMTVSLARTTVLQLRPGTYRLEVRLEDDAGNRRRALSRPYLVIHPTKNLLVGRFERAGRRVALTFDDCIFGSSWSSILATLSRHQVKAAFFCPALQVRSHPAQARATVKAGHTLGAHGYDHAKMTTLSYSQALWRLTADRDVWWPYGASGTPYFRPPYGAFNWTTRDAAAQAGYRYTVMWDVDPLDWTNPGAKLIAARVLREARPGSVILLHVKPQTAQALPMILQGLKHRALQPVSLDVLARSGTPSPMGW